MAQMTIPPYPHNDNKKIYGEYIGEIVVYVHYRHRDGRPRFGKLIDVESGCNGLLRVKWLEEDHTGWYCGSDLALKKCWPDKRWPHEE